jgi:fumarylacetoacetase
LPYLDSPANRERGAIDIRLELRLQTAAMRAAGQAPECIGRSGYAEAAYWSMAQLVAHHTINGCALAPGDLLGTGTLSGREPDEAGSLLELTQGGTRPIRLANGERRAFLEDGDAVALLSSHRLRRLRRHRAAGSERGPAGSRLVEPRA